MIQEKLIDKDSPENMVVEESPVKEKHPPIPEISSPKQEKQSSTTKNTVLSSLSTTPMASSANIVKESTPRVGVKRTLAQSFDEVEHSPAKRQRLEEPANISRSAEIPANTAKKSCLSPAKHTRSEPKQKTLHQVRFMLPSKLIVKPHASSETESPAKKINSGSSSDNSRQSKEISSSESDQAPRPSTKKAAIVPIKKSKYKSRYVESKSKRIKAVQKKSDGKSSKRQSLISVILESSESESEESSRSESEERRKKSHNKREKSSKKRSTRSDSSEESESVSDSDSDARSKKKRSQSRSKHSSSASKSKSKSKHKRAETSEASESDAEYSDSNQSSSCSDSESASRSDDSDSERSDASDRSRSESESTVEDKRKDWSDNSNEVTKTAPVKDSLSSDLSSQPVKESATAEDPSSDSATTYRKTSSDILREEEENERAAQQNPMASVVVESKERTDETSSLASSQTVPVQLTLEERIDQITTKTTLDAVSCIDDLKAVLIAVYRKLGCDRAYLIKEIIEHTLPLLPKSYTSTDPNWEIKLTDTLLVITDVIPRPNALYYRLKNEFFPKLSLEEKLQVEHCPSDESTSSDSQPKPVQYVSPSVNVRDSEEILINGSYEEIFIRLRKKKALLADITKRKMEPESIKALKRSHGLGDKKDDRLLCGGLSDDEVRLVLSALAELFPKIASEFVLSSLFTTAVAIILLSRRPGTHHDDILAKIGTRCVEVQARGSGSDNCVLMPVEVQEGLARFN